MEIIVSYGDCQSSVNVSVVAASLVPAMQKGSEPARIAHIAANILNILLFASQIPSGLEIVWKVLENTSW